MHRDVKPSNILLRPVSPGAANSIHSSRSTTR
jgi:serine/threonine protein kinase